MQLMDSRKFQADLYVAVSNSDLLFSHA